MTWYKNGLKFECTKCGNCCTGSPGYVWITIEELYRIADFLGLKEDDFVRKYVRKIDKRLSLVELPGGNCVFYDNGCTIYPVRPVQCRTFPFWREILEKPGNWKQTADECPGIGVGKIYTEDEITALLNER